MKKVLVAKSGPLKDGVYTIAGRTLIGRDAESDIQVLDSGVSRKHACVLEQDDGSVLMRDLGSHNGTLVRGQRLKEAVLDQGDEITIGESVFEYREVIGDADKTSEIELKLVSGPAQAQTATVPIDPEHQEALMEQLRKSEPTLPGAFAACCDNPLAARARTEGWKFCPSCGAAIQH